MADFYKTFSALSQYRLHATISEYSVSPPNNYSRVSSVLKVEKTLGSGYSTGNSGNTGGINGSINIGAIAWAPYDFSAYSSRQIGSGIGTVYHESDGTKTASGTYFANDSAGGNMGSASASWALGLTPIDRDALERFDGSGWRGNFLERWNGTAWVQQVLERFDGSSWKRQK